MLLIMFIINFMLSYFIMSNIMIYKMSHLYNTSNKIYMGIFMAALMGIFELWLMEDRNDHFFTYNILFLLLTIFSAIAIRNQIFINDDQYLKSMIEHHSGALLMSHKFILKTKDKQLIKLANNIIKSQSSEINHMKQLIKN